MTLSPKPLALSPSAIAIALILPAIACGGDSNAIPVGPTAPALGLTCPAAITTASQTGAPIAIRYSSAISSGGSSPVQIACKPDNDSLFPTGVTTVTCTATDAKAASATCAFTVTVTGPGRISATNFTAFGDSITEGEVVSETGAGIKVLRLDLAKSYPFDLQTQLQSRYGAQSISVANLGKYGETTVDGAVRLTGALQSGSQALLLMEGSNDLGATPLATSMSNLRSMVQFGKSHGQRVFLATIPPQGVSVTNGCPVRNSAYGLVQPFNDAVRGLAASEGVTLVDIYAALSGNVTAYIDCDGLHPTPAGYQEIANTFFTAIKAAFETAAPSRTHS